MCTVINQTDGYHLFGRTLDLPYTYGEEVVITPRGYPLPLAHQPPTKTTHTIMGVAHVEGDFPLYYDAVSECGLCMAALNFPDYATYHPPVEGERNLASFELMLWLLGECNTIEDALDLLKNTNITPHPFNANLPATPLHWMLSDAHTSVVIESTKAGLEIHPNPLHAMTNAPTFPQQLTRLADLMHLSPKPPVNTLCPNAPLPLYSHGMGSVGLPGDMTSFARLARGVYANTHTCHEGTREGEVNRFFHVMDMVSQPKGCAVTPDGKPIYTVYTSCGDPREMTYYVTTYETRRVRKIKAKASHKEGSDLVRFPLRDTPTLA